MSEAKPFGYELMDVKLGSVITRLNSTIRRIKKYLDELIFNKCGQSIEASHVWRNWKKRDFHTLRKMRTNVKITGVRLLVEVI